MVQKWRLHTDLLLHCVWMKFKWNPGDVCEWTHCNLRPNHFKLRNSYAPNNSLQNQNIPTIFLSNIYHWVTSFDSEAKWNACKHGWKSLGRKHHINIATNQNLQRKITGTKILVTSEDFSDAEILLVQQLLLHCNFPSHWRAPAANPVSQMIISRKWS